MSVAAMRGIEGRCLLLGVIALTAAAPAKAGDTYWQHDPAAPGDWFSPGNWSSGVPVLYEDAYIDNAGTAVILNGTAEVWWLWVGYSQAGTVSQSGGVLTMRETKIGFESGAVGRYVLSGSGEIVGEAIHIGTDGHGTFTQEGGSVNVIGYGSLSVSRQAGSYGRYFMKAGSLDSKRAFVGGEDGLMVQTGGTVSLSTSLGVSGVNDSEARYELSGNGELFASREYIGTYGLGRFVQTGGVNTLGDLMQVGSREDGNGTYELHEGRVQFLSTGDMTVGDRGVGHFIQTGGVNDADRTVILGWDPGGHGTYTISGGEMAPEYLWVGRLGTGAFEVVGGMGNISAGEYRQKADCTLISRINQTGLSPIKVTETAALAGDWTVVDDDASHGRFDVLRAAGGIEGTFSNVVLPDGPWSWGIDDDVLWVQTPEPATLAVLALGGLALIRRRRT